LFGGSFSVGINSNIKNLVYNDSDVNMCNFMKECLYRDREDIICNILHVIKKYKPETNVGYNLLKNDFNVSGNVIYFYVLCCYCFNQNPLYGVNGDFISSIGNSTTYFNENLKRRMKYFINEMKNKNIKIYNLDFEDVPIIYNSLIYIDPPYKIVVGKYVWKEKDDNRLFEYIRNLNNVGMKFILSNNLNINDIENKSLLDFSSEFNLINIDTNYNRIKRGNNNTQCNEVIVTNINRIK
jgi:hypothetical protein